LDKVYLRYFNVSLGIIGLILLVTGCAVNPVTGKSDFVMMSEDQEIKLGHDSHPDILKQYGLYDDPALQSYVQSIGQSLAAVSHRTNLAYHFTVLDSPMVNAFALPGGYVYITRGLMAYLNSDAELAAVLGHEIGHVTARHSVRQISAARATQIGYSIGSILVPELQNQAAESIFNTLGSAILSGYGREDELEADHLGSEYLARDGYDPKAMIRVLEILKSQENFEKQLAAEEGREPHIYHGVFASHPDNDTRLQQVVGSADQFKRNTPIHEDRQGYLDHIDGLVFGNSEREGIVHDNVFYHGALGIAFEFPSDWKINNLPDHLIAQPPANDGVVEVTVDDLSRPYTPREFMTIQLKLSNLREEEEIKPSGLEGYTALVPVKTSFGRRDARISVIHFNEHAFVFVGVAKDEKNQQQYDKDFLAMAKSFHPLAAQEESLAKPLTIHLYRVQQGDNVEKIATRSSLSKHVTDQLRLLNGIYPQGEPVAGQEFKVVQ